MRNLTLTGEIPDSWNLKRVSMKIEFLDTPICKTPKNIRFSTKANKSHYDTETMIFRKLMPLDGINRSYSWDAGLVQPGSYEINVRSYSTTIQVSHEGKTDAVC